MDSSTVSRAGTIGVRPGDWTVGEVGGQVPARGSGRQLVSEMRSAGVATGTTGEF